MSWIWRLELNWDKTPLIHFKTVLYFWWPQSKKRFVISKMEKVRKALRKLILCLCRYFNFWLFPSHSNARNHYPPILGCLFRNYPLLQLVIFYFIFKMKQGIPYRAQEVTSSIWYTCAESAQCTLSKDELRWVDHAIYTLGCWCPRFWNGYKFLGRNQPEHTKFLYCIDILYLFIYLFIIIIIIFFFLSLPIWFSE